jgi:hypothetical protein
MKNSNGVLAEASGGASMEEPGVLISEPAVADRVSLAPIEGFDF